MRWAAAWFSGRLNRSRRLIFVPRGATLAPAWPGLSEPSQPVVGRICVADHQVHDLTPEDVSKGMEEGRYLLVDVREPNEVAVEAYPDGVVVPLSDLRSGGHSGPAGQAGGFRLPFGQALGDGLAGGPGGGPSL